MNKQRSEVENRAFLAEGVDSATFSGSPTICPSVLDAGRRLYLHLEV